MNVRTSTHLALLMLASAAMLYTSLPARADSTQTSADNRFYISGMVSRALDGTNSNGKEAGYTVSIGKPITDNLGLELDAQQYKVTTGHGYGDYDLRQRKIGLNGLIFLHRGSAWNPYIGLGLGNIRSDFHGHKDNNNYLSAGVGVFWRVAKYLDIRGDLRFNRMLDGIGPFSDVTVNSPVASIGFAIPFGAPPRAVPVAAQVQPSPPPVVDSDHDGVSDSADRCPNTPSGAAVDEHGCPLDEDNDGVPDYLDQCANTPADTPVDVHGCAIHNTITLKNVPFALNSSDLLGDAQTSLDDAVADMKKFPVLHAQVAGYTDSTGAAAYNQQLSEKRAQSVMAYLVEHGVEADRLTAKGYGEASPVASNQTAAGRAENRRVELHILNLDALKGTTTIQRH